MKPTPTDSHSDPHKANMVPFPLEFIIGKTVTDFDLYLEANRELTLYAKSPYRWSFEEIERLKHAGKEFFFYSTVDHDKALIYRAINRIPDICETEKSPFKLIKITEAAAELNRVLFKHKTPLTLAALDRVQSLAHHMVATIQEDPHCIGVLTKLAHHDDYTFHHSARVCAYSLAIATQLSLNERPKLVEMATGALLHDIGKSQIDLTILNKPGVLSPLEWEQMKKHPIFGTELIVSSTLTHVARQIILSHHERFDGSGYPHQLQERELLEEVKIVAFADTFDALTTNRPYQQSRSAFQALDLIRHKLLKNMHKDSYKALVELISSGHPREDLGVAE
jgi:putative nucleotidyltransferase with HDIG domain